MTAVTGIAVGTVLQAGVGEGIGDHIHLGLFQEAHQLKGKVVIVVVHGGGVTGGHTALHFAHQRFTGHCLYKAGLVIGVLIAMDIDEGIVLFRQVKDEFDIAQAVLRAVFHVGQAAHNVAAQLHGVFHHLGMALCGKDAFLRERNDLKVHQILHFLTHFQQGLHYGAGRLGSVGMGTQEHGTVGDFPFDDVAGIFLDGLFGQTLHALSPDVDAFNEGAAHIVARLTDAQDGIQVQMGVAEGGGDQFAGHIDGLIGGVIQPRADLGKDAVFQIKIAQFFVTAHLCIFDQNSTHGLLPPFRENHFLSATR